MSEVLFSGAAWIIHGTINAVFWLVFGFALVILLAGPAVTLADHYRRGIVDALGLIAWVGAGCRRRHRMALLPSAQPRRDRQRDHRHHGDRGCIRVSPITVFNAGVNTLGSAATSVLSLTTDPNAKTAEIPTDNSKIHAPQFADRATAFQNRLETRIIGIPAEAITFGALLPAPCEKLYHTSLVQGHDVTDANALQPMADSPQCAKYAKAAAHPQASRLCAAAAFLLAALFIALGWALLCIGPLKAHIRWAVALAGFWFLALGLALPDRLREGAAGFVAKLGKDALVIIVTAFAIASTIITMDAAIDAAKAKGATAVILIAVIVSWAPILIARGTRKAVNKVHVPASRGSSERHDRRLNPTAELAGVGALGAALGHSLPVRTAKTALLGSKGRAGLLAGPSGRTARNDLGKTLAYKDEMRAHKRGLANDRQRADREAERSEERPGPRAPRAPRRPARPLRPPRPPSQSCHRAASRRPTQHAARRRQVGLWAPPLAAPPRPRVARRRPPVAPAASPLDPRPRVLRRPRRRRSARRSPQHPPHPSRRSRPHGPRPRRPAGHASRC